MALQCKTCAWAMCCHVQASLLAALYWLRDTVPPQARQSESEAACLVLACSLMLACLPPLVVDSEGAAAGRRLCNQQLSMS